MVMLKIVDRFKSFVKHIEHDIYEIFEHFEKIVLSYKIFVFWQ
jgi:Txe/YoeB family toxin of Txe-Axe toxin-antitoxin module